MSNLEHLFLPPDRKRLRLKPFLYLQVFGKSRLRLELLLGWKSYFTVRRRVHTSPPRPLVSSDIPRWPSPIPGTFARSTTAPSPSPLFGVCKDTVASEEKIVSFWDRHPHPHVVHARFPRCQPTGAYTYGSLLRVSNTPA
jgi:hypothetical protein